MKPSLFVTSAFRRRIFWLLAIAIHWSLALPLSSHADSNGLTILEAVQLTLERNPQVRIQQQAVSISRGVRIEQAGQFDTISNSHVDFNQHFEDRVRVRASGFGTSVGKRQRSGRFVGAQLDVSRLNDPEENALIPNTGTINFFVDQPLLRGRGVGTFGAEKASVYAMNTERFELFGEISDRIAATANAYWDYLAANERALIVDERLERAMKRYLDTQRLVEKDEQPRSNLFLVGADVSETQALKAVTDAAKYTAKQTLGIVIGIDFEEIESLPLAVDWFPELDPRQLPPSNELTSTGQIFLSQRNELIAAEYRLKSAYVLYLADQQNAKPDLTVRLNAGYSNVEYGSGFRRYFDVLAGTPPGTNAGINLIYQRPINNTERTGRVIQTQALFLQQKIVVEDLRRTILSEIAVSLNQLRADIQSYEQRHLAAEKFQTALVKEYNRYQYGMATLLDVLQVEASFTDALLARIEAAANVSKSLVELRRVTGTFISPYDAEVRLSDDTFFSIPNPLSNTEVRDAATK